MAPGHPLQPRGARIAGSARRDNPVADEVPEGRQDTQVPSRNNSPTDPAAQWTAARGGPAFYAYSTNYLIDLSAGIIVDVKATLANRTPEVESTRTMIDRVEERFDIRSRRLVGDTAYGTAPLLGWLAGWWRTSRAGVLQLPRTCAEWPSG